MFVILLGPPGAGKGTQAERLQEHFQAPHVASGDLFRTNIQHGTDLGRLAKEYMDAGTLVPDDVVIKMIMSRLAEPDCANGVILDGFPRTVAQAEALDQTLNAQGNKVTAALYVAVAVPTLLDRLSGRWTCPKDQSTYHDKFNPPKNDHVCDICGTLLYQREDDKRSVAENRLQVYFNQTTPVIEYYREHNLLTEIVGEQEIDKVTADMVAAIEAAEGGNSGQQSALSVQQ